jgi:hypothetical protein
MMEAIRPPPVASVHTGTIRRHVPEYVMLLVQLLFGSFVGIANVERNHLWAV